MEEISEAEQCRHWRLLWLSAIQAFADSDTQHRRWTDPQERNPAYSYVECMCTYFDDAYMGEEHAFECRILSGRMSRQEAAATTDFHFAADAYRPPNEDAYDIDAILADPAWQNVVALAQACQRRLIDLLSDQNEIDALSRPLEWSEGNGIFRAATTGSFIVPAAPRRRSTLAGFIRTQLRKLWAG